MEFPVTGNLLEIYIGYRSEMIYILYISNRFPSCNRKINFSSSATLQLLVNIVMRTLNKS